METMESRGLAVSDEKDFSRRMGIDKAEPGC
jgi:hypothetical protein